MFCSKCNHEVSPGAKFCPECGVPVEDHEISGMGGSDSSVFSPPRNSGLAIAALICGLIGFCTIGISALVGIVLGIMALVRISKNPRQQKGMALAISGITASVLLSPLTFYSPSLLIHFGHAA